MSGLNRYAAEARSRMEAKYGPCAVITQDNDPENEYPVEVHRANDPLAFSIGTTEEEAWIDAMTSNPFGYESADMFKAHVDAIEAAK